MRLVLTVLAAALCLAACPRSGSDIDADTTVLKDRDVALKAQLFYDTPQLELDVAVGRHDDVCLRPDRSVSVRSGDVAIGAFDGIGHDCSKHGCVCTELSMNTEMPDVGDGHLEAVDDNGKLALDIPTLFADRTVRLASTSLTAGGAVSFTYPRDDDGFLFDVRSFIADFQADGGPLVLDDSMLIEPDGDGFSGTVPTSWSGTGTLSIYGWVLPKIERCGFKSCTAEIDTMTTVAVTIAP